MKVLIEYEARQHPNVIKVSETRNIDDDCYPRIIGKVAREMFDNGYTLLNLRCLDPHPKDLIRKLNEKE